MVIWQWRSCSSQRLNAEPGAEEASRANMLRWVNSAFNCLDQANYLGHAAALDQIHAELHALLKKASMA